MPLTIELTMLLWSVALVILLVLPYVIGRMKNWSLNDMFGNRDNPPPVPPWVDRAHRAHRNMLENLTPFAALVMMSYATGHTSALTAIGASLYFFSRLAHAILYIFGIPVLRTFAWIGGIAGMAMIFVELLL